LKLLGKTLLFILLTLLTQIGGLVYILAHINYSFLHKFSNRFLRSGLKLGVFLAFYTLATFVLVPRIAPQFGRVPLPVRETSSLQPLTFLSPFLNRHYVRPELKETALLAARKMSENFPGSRLNYLDASFPFLNGFPLIPHLSHNDGKKLDLAFFYTDSQSGEPTNHHPSRIGYGVCEDPLPGEENTSEFCAQQGYWQHSFLTAVVPQKGKSRFRFDGQRTASLVRSLASSEAIGKIFIEPHLKARLGLTGDKIRFHGCQAVRHNDHIHVQLK
jgi:hypothetical protein